MDVKLTSTQEAELVDQITRSKVFQGSDTLCRLLRYLVEKSHEEPGSALKEYRIATEVFGRKDDFDPRSDSSVRVQVARLRLKLHEYTLTEGIHDPVVVTIPKGAYKLSFAPAQNQPVPARPTAPAEHDESELPAHASHHASGNHSAEFETLLEAASHHPSKSWRLAALVLAALLICSLAGLSYFWRMSQPRTTAADRPAADPVVRAFWAPFLAKGNDIWVVFSNATFVGRPLTGMHYYQPRQDPPGELQDHYTGVGEVLSVHELDATFYSLGTPLRVKRGALLSLDDVKTTNLIFVGAPVENLTLNDIPTTRFFKFRSVTQGPRQGDVEVVNVQPAAKEAATYINADSHPITDDYAIIARLPGLEQGRQIIIAAGTTTIGTQAAVEFLCHPDTLRQLQKALGSGSEGKPFEALLHIKVARGVPVNAEIVAHRMVN